MNFLKNYKIFLLILGFATFSKTAFLMEDNRFEIIDDKIQRLFDIEFDITWPENEGFDPFRNPNRFGAPNEPREKALIVRERFREMARYLEEKLYFDELNIDNIKNFTIGRIRFWFPYLRSTFIDDATKREWINGVERKLCEIESKIDEFFRRKAYSNPFHKSQEPKRQEDRQPVSFTPTPSFGQIQPVRSMPLPVVQIANQRVKQPAPSRFFPETRTEARSFARPVALRPQPCFRQVVTTTTQPRQEELGIQFGDILENINANALRVTNIIQNSNVTIESLESVVAKLNELQELKVRLESELQIKKDEEFARKLQEDLNRQ